MKKAVLIFSGGLDSTTLLHQILSEKKFEISLLTFFYGQKHDREIESAKFFAEKFSLNHKIISLNFFPKIAKSSLLKTGDKIPAEKYDAENLQKTVVPNRNMILLSIAASFAISQNARDIFYGAHAGDHAIYPDCRPIFIEKMREVLRVCDFEKLNLHALFQDLKKSEIVKIGKKLGVDFSKTWSCYNGGAKPCGACGACRDRAESFAKNKISDPLLR
jgi:7-cyano-7-deazaguanine synthase